MKLVLIFGPQAVGKMTVGQELEKITGLKLFHDHMPIELVSNFFDYPKDPEGKRLVRLFRREIFEAVSKSSLYGLIHSFVWLFGLTELEELKNKEIHDKNDHDRIKELEKQIQQEWDYVNNLCGLFESCGAEIYFVELEADFNERIERNKTPNRHLHKPSKRNIELSESWVRDTEIECRSNSLPGEINRKNYIRINNTDIAPEKIAGFIKNIFEL